VNVRVTAVGAVAGVGWAAGPGGGVCAVAALAIDSAAKATWNPAAILCREPPNGSSGLSALTSVLQQKRPRTQTRPWPCTRGECAYLEKSATIFPLFTPRFWENAPRYSSYTCVRTIGSVMAS